MGEWRYSFAILKLGTRWRRVFSFTPRPLYPWGKIPRYPLDMRLGGPQGQSGYYREEEISCPYRESNPDSSAVQPLVWSLYNDLGMNTI
jgi:hypothetical protein